MSHGDTAETPIENDQRHSVADLVMQFGALIALRSLQRWAGPKGCRPFPLYPFLHSQHPSFAAIRTGFS